MSIAWDSNVDLHVDVAFGDNPFASPLSWTDIAQYVLRWDTTRGRQSYNQHYPAGRARVVLDNTAGDLEVNVNLLVDDADISADGITWTDNRRNGSSTPVTTTRMYLAGNGAGRWVLQYWTLGSNARPQWTSSDDGHTWTDNGLNGRDRAGGVVYDAVSGRFIRTIWRYNGDLASSPLIEVETSTNGTSWSTIGETLPNVTGDHFICSDTAPG